MTSSRENSGVSKKNLKNYIHVENSMVSMIEKLKILGKIVEARKKSVKIERVISGQNAILWIVQKLIRIKSTKIGKIRKIRE